MKKLIGVCLVALAMVSPAMADGGGGADYSALIGAADWATVAVGVVTIAAALAGVLVAMRGSRKLLSMIGR